MLEYLHDLCPVLRVIMKTQRENVVYWKSNGKMLFIGNQMGKSIMKPYLHLIAIFLARAVINTY